jgi:hypothetical protein
LGGAFLSVERSGGRLAHPNASRGNIVCRIILRGRSPAVDQPVRRSNCGEATTIGQTIEIGVRMVAMKAMCPLGTPNSISLSAVMESAAAKPTCAAHTRGQATTRSDVDDIGARTGGHCRGHCRLAQGAPGG